MSKSLLLLDATQKMQANGLGNKTAILGLIEQKYLSEAVAQLMNTRKAYKNEDVLRTANEILPAGLPLEAEYQYTLRSINAVPLRNIEELYKRVKMAAVGLEFLSAKALATKDTATHSIPKFAEAEQRIGEAYAQVIETVDELDGLDAISVEQHQEINNYLFESDGPLQQFLPKAMAIVNDHLGEKQKVYAHQR